VGEFEIQVDIGLLEYAWWAHFIDAANPDIAYAFHNQTSSLYWLVNHNRPENAMFIKVTE
jgi:hypothetical protein